MRFIIKRKVFITNGRAALLIMLFACLLPLPASPSLAEDAFVVGDIQYKPVADVVSGLRSVLKIRMNVYATSDVRGRLNSVVRKEGARLVVALGKDAVDEAVKLPPAITVVYGLVIAPPKTARPNITGVYMSTPVVEYINAVRKYLPSIKKISVVGSQYLINILDGYRRGQVEACRVSSSSELVDTVNRIDDSDAILLLPDAALLTAAVMDKVYLFSYRKNIPLLGISEGNVKRGSLFAIVFDPESVGRQLGEKAAGALNDAGAGQVPPSPPAEFNLYLNTNTARKMGITFAAEMARKAHKVYP